jgi:hypothetical protein
MLEAMAKDFGLPMELVKEMYQTNKGDIEKTRKAIEEILA